MKILEGIAKAILLVLALVGLAYYLLASGAGVGA